MHNAKFFLSFGDSPSREKSALDKRTKLQLYRSRHYTKTKFGLKQFTISVR